jgi:hypothetical protein
MPYLFWPAQRSIKALKIARHPVDFLKRRRYASRLSLSDQRISKTDGFLRRPLHQIAGAEDVFEHCRGCISEWEARHPGPHDAIATHILADENSVTDLRNHSILQKFAQSPQILGIVSDYLGEVPIVSGVTIQITHPNKNAVGFQRFHIDREDRRQIKLFVAIEDVDEQSGPLHFLSAHQSEVLETNERHYAGRIDDEVVQRYAGREGLQVGTLNSGDGLFLDTCRCVHFGSRGNKKPRYFLVIQYPSRFAPVEPASICDRLKVDSRLANESSLTSLLYPA